MLARSPLASGSSNAGSKLDKMKGVMSSIANATGSSPSRDDVPAPSLDQVVSLDVLAHHLHVHLSGPVDAGPSHSGPVQGSRGSQYSPREIRGRLVKDIIWADVGEGKSFPTGLDLPLYCLYDKYRMRSLGLPAAHVPSWIDTLLGKLDRRKDSIAGLSPPCSAAETFVDLKVIKFPTFDNLSLYLRLIDRLSKLRLSFDTVLADLHSPACPIRRFVSLDIEAFESAPRKLTEFGIAIYERDSKTLTSHHIIVREHLRLRNSRFASDAKHQFAYGESVRWSTGQAMSFLAEQLAIPGSALLGHSLNSDIRFVQRAKLPMGGQRVAAALLETISKYDLQHLYRCRGATDRHHKLEDICAELSVPTVTMHNAGNDAALTLAAFLRLMRIDTVTPVQHQARLR